MTDSSFNMIVSQGRVADRASGMIKGAFLTAEAIEKRYGVKGNYVGTSTPAENDKWPESLEKAQITLREINEKITNSIVAKKPIVLISNTCSVSLATLPIVSSNYENAIVVWIDAHGDFNTPEISESGYLGGMVVSAACGLWDSGFGANLNPSQLIILGARDIDSSEQELLDKYQVKVLPPNKCNTKNILDFIGDKPIWIHIDWDVLEPGYLPADYVVPEGLYPQDIKNLLKALSTKQVLGIELAEFNATKNDSVNNEAVNVILDMTSPILDKFTS